MVDRLMLFGLTRQEAVIYVCLSQNGALNGYETAKITGISRSNVYSGLGGLVDKGAAYLVEGASNKYLAVPAEELCDNYMRRMMEAKQYLTANLIPAGKDTEGYITIEGHRHILDKIYAMLEKTEHRIYFSLPSEYVYLFQQQISCMISEGKKVVLLTDKKLTCPEGVQVYVSEPKEKQIHLIVDSQYVLTGDFSESDRDTCLYSGQKNFVNVLKEAIRNEIRLTELGVRK